MDNIWHEVVFHSHSVAYICDVNLQKCTLLQMNHSQPIVLEGISMDIWLEIDGKKNIEELGIEFIPEGDIHARNQFAAFISDLIDGDFLCLKS